MKKITTRIVVVAENELSDEKYEDMVYPVIENTDMETPEEVFEFSAKEAVRESFRDDKLKTIDSRSYIEDQ